MIPTVASKANPALIARAIAGQVGGGGIGPTVASKSKPALLSQAVAGSVGGGGGIRQLATNMGKEGKIDPSSPPHPERPPNAQDFVKVRIEPGQWVDDDRTDPTYHPQWKKNRARIISAEDYANRPKAGFSEQFASPRDAMLTLCWLTQEDRDNIYQLYLDMMESMAKSDRGVTSHEYVMRVVAQKFGISTARAAAIVQLQHNEDRIRKEKPEQKIYYEVQEYMDAKIREHIHKLYEFYGEEPPKGFMEDPVGVDGSGDPDRRTSGSSSAEDLYDVDAMTRQALIRKKSEAQLSIDGHVYVEDVDDAARDVKLDGNAKKLMDAARTAVLGDDEAASDSETQKASLRPDDQAPLPDNGRGIGGAWAGKDDPDSPGRRPRWKFAAKIIDTGKDAKKAKRNRTLKKAKDEGIANTLIEQGGKVRPATVDEAGKVSWRPLRNEKEFMFKGVKQAWLDRTLRGKMDAWGKVERDLEKERLMDEQARGEGDTAGENEGKQTEGGTSEEESSDDESKS